MVLVRQHRSFSADSVVTMFNKNTRINPNWPQIHYRKDGKYTAISRGEFRQYVFQCVSALIDAGVRKGDHIAIYSANCWQWWVADMASLIMGAVVVPIYPTNSEEETLYIIKHAGVKICFTSGDEQFRNAAAVKKRFSSLKLIITMENRKGTGVVFFDAFLKKGQKKQNDALIEKKMSLVKSKDLATIIYTSGTTGNPKGVMLTHGNLVSDVLQLADVFGDYLADNDIFLSFLPLSHALERAAGYYAPIMFSSQVAFAESVRTVSEDMKEIQPTVLISVPRLYEKIHAGINSAIKSMPFHRRMIINAAFTVGMRNIPNVCANRKPSGFAGAVFSFFDSIVLAKMRYQIGMSRLKLAVSGGGPLSRNDTDFLLSMGVGVFEGFGLTEAAPVTHVGRVGKIRPGTVGTAMCDTKALLSDEGELLIKGPQVMKGYYREKKSTKETFTKNGYLKTGDLGKIDGEGYLTIMGRIKDIIVTSGGKNISPQNIEEALKKSNYIEHAAIVGDRMKFLSAIIVPDFIELEKWAAKNKISFSSRDDLVSMKEVKSLISNDLEVIMKKFSRVEQIRAFTIIPDTWGIDTGELTPTLKVKRRIITEKYAAQIKELYREK